MSLNVILGNAASGLRAAQTGIRVASDNIANVDNASYVRKVVDTRAAAYGGVGAGVEVVGVRRLADQFLQTASLGATSAAGQAGVTADFMDQVQSLFGLPTESYSVSSKLQTMFSGFTALAGADPTLTARMGALSSVSSFFDTASSFSDNLADVVTQADGRARDDVNRANILLKSIAEQNREISKGVAVGADVSGLQQQQSEMIDELSGMLDIRVQHNEMGMSIIRAFDGREIASNVASPLSLEMGPNNTRQLVIHTEGADPQAVDGLLRGGSIKGYLDFINVQAPDVNAQLNEMVNQTALQLNRVHNAYSSVPAPTTLQGKAVTDLDALVASQTGVTTIAKVDGAGVMTDKFDIDFAAGTVDGVAFTDGASFVAALNTALGPAGGATFTSGRLNLSGGGEGIVMSSAPSPATGDGFSFAFGLNDLVVGESPDFTVRADIVASPGKLSLAQADLSGTVAIPPAVGQPIILKGDARGADALGQSGTSNVAFNAAGGQPAGPQSIIDYVMSFGSYLARKADEADVRQSSQQAVAAEATARRTSFEGVNLDEELVSLTTFQQSYAASARVMQAVNDIYDVLLNIGR